MNNKDYRISNIYYMLAYAFRFDKLIESNNIFENKKGTLVSRYSAQVTEKAVTEFTVE